MPIHTTLDDLERASVTLDLIAAALEAYPGQANGQTAAQIAPHFLRLKVLKEATDKAYKRISGTFEKLNKGVLPERLEHEGVDLIRVPELARSFSVQPKVSAVVIDKPMAFEWLRERGDGDLIQETVNAQTLATFCRHLIKDEGIEPPEEAIKVTTYKTIGITKYTPK